MISWKSGAPVASIAVNAHFRWLLLSIEYHLRSKSTSSLLILVQIFSPAIPASSEASSISTGIVQRINSAAISFFSYRLLRTVSQSESTMILSIDDDLKNLFGTRKFFRRCLFLKDFNYMLIQPFSSEPFLELLVNIFVITSMNLGDCTSMMMLCEAIHHRC